MKLMMHATAARSRLCGSVRASKRRATARVGAHLLSGAEANKALHDMTSSVLLGHKKTEESHLSTGSRSGSAQRIIALESLCQSYIATSPRARQQMPVSRDATSHA